ncbi:MAG: hypothetical protein ACXWT1_06575 [Methylobacter sp.]
MLQIIPENTSFGSNTRAIKSTVGTSQHNVKKISPRTTAWTDIYSCNICIHHIHVDYAGDRAMQGQLPRHEEKRGKNFALFVPSW